MIIYKEFRRYLIILLFVNSLRETQLSIKYTIYIYMFLYLTNIVNIHTFNLIYIKYKTKQDGLDALCVFLV